MDQHLALSVPWAARMDGPGVPWDDPFIIAARAWQACVAGRALSAGNGPGVVSWPHLPFGQAERPFQELLEMGRKVQRGAFRSQAGPPAWGRCPPASFAAVK